MSSSAVASCLNARTSVCPVCGKVIVGDFVIANNYLLHRPCSQYYSKPAAPSALEGRTVRLNEKFIGVAAPQLQLDALLSSSPPVYSFELEKKVLEEAAASKNKSFALPKKKTSMHVVLVDETNGEGQLRKVLVPQTATLDDVFKRCGFDESQFDVKLWFEGQQLQDRNAKLSTVGVLDQSVLQMRATPRLPSVASFQQTNPVVDDVPCERCHRLVSFTSYMQHLQTCKY